MKSNDPDSKSCPIMETVNRIAAVAGCPINAGDQPTRWVRRKDARPGEILDAALDLFVAKGFSATKVEDIARAAGVTAGTIYRYYAGKEDMLRALIRDDMAAKIGEGEQMLGDFQGTGPELLTFVLRTWWQLIGATRISGLPKLILAEANNFPDLAELHRELVIVPGEALIARALQYGIDRGEFRPMPVDVMVQVVVAPVLMGMLWRHTPACNTREFDVDTYLDQVIETLVNGLAVRPAP
jgi:AcrR family transcriptional regulator